MPKSSDHRWAKVSDRYLLAEHVFSKVVIFERRNRVGGVWNYTPLARAVNTNGYQQSADKAIDVATANLPDLNTPMYEGLESNLPHMLMQFSDVPFAEGTQLFASRENVMEYLENYAQEVEHLIKYNCEVIDVRPKRDHKNGIWEVMTKSLSPNDIHVEHFDAVVSANGHCDWPLLPDIEGLDDWSRAFPQSLHHSVSYKNPLSFCGKVSPEACQSLIALQTEFIRY